MSALSSDQRKRALGYFFFGLNKQAEDEIEPATGFDASTLFEAHLAVTTEPDYIRGAATVRKHDGTYRSILAQNFRGNWSFWSGVIAGFWTQDQSIFNDQADRCAYVTRQYARFENLHEAALRALLQDVFDGYPEHQENGFEAMVAKFATDDFYNMHYVARAYLLALAS